MQTSIRKTNSSQKKLSFNDFRVPTDNQSMLQKIQKQFNPSHLYIPEESHISIDSKVHKQYSPQKEKVKKQLDQLDIQLRNLRNKNNGRFDKWDHYAPYSFVKLSHQEKDNLFQSLFQDFRFMRVIQNQYVQKYLQLFVKLQKCQKEISKFKKKGALSAKQKIEVYKEQNHQNKQLKQQIQRLHQKIMALTSGKPIQKPKLSNNKTFNNTQKAIFPVNQNIKAQLQLQRKHVKQLLQVIDDLRRNKIKLEGQMKDKNFNQSLSNIKLKDGERPGRGKSSNISDNKFKEYADELLIWKQKHHQLQLIYDRMNQDKDRSINELKKELIEIRQSQRMRKNLQMTNNRPNFMNFGNQDEIQNLKQEKRRLQVQIKQMIGNSLFKDNSNNLVIQKKNGQLQDELKKLKLKHEQTKKQKTQYFSELQLKTKESADYKQQVINLKKQLKQLMEKDIVKQGGNISTWKYDQNDYYRKLLHLVKLQGDDPVWKKYADLQSPLFTTMNQTQLKQLSQNLWKNKLELLAHLQKAQIQLKTNKQTNESKLNYYLNQKERLQQELRLATARLDQWQSMDRVHAAKRNFQLFQYHGIKYNDSISVFEDTQDQVKALDHNQNFFDLFLGQLNLDQTNILRHPQNKIKSISSLISFLTVDFYNHPTQHSNFSEGLSKKLLNNYSYKVEINSYFIKFLSKNSIAIELWSPQGTSTVLFGKGQIWLNDLLSSTSKDISNVVRGKCPIYSQNKTLIATMQYRMRMRLPISPFTEWANNKQSLKNYSKLDPFAINQRKKLSITVDKAEGLRSSGNTFVYFNIQNQDFFTEPQLGSSPFWDYNRQIDVIVDQDFSAYLKENYIQFTLFDDDKQVNEDVVGIAKASLTPLLQSNNPLDLILDIQNPNFDIVGKLKIKAFWS